MQASVSMLAVGSRAAQQAQLAHDAATALASFLNSFKEAVKNTFGRRDTQSNNARPGLFLAAFGKHPGWDDHIDDLGVETESLVWAKDLLYIKGIADNIDAGKWDKLDASERLEQFNHGFIWKIEDTLIVGRLWSSTDGKGRARYPMVLAVECTGLPVAWVLENVPPRLEALQKECVATRSAEVVTANVDVARSELRTAAAQASRKKSAAAASFDPLLVIQRCPDMGENQVGLLSVLYEIEHDMAAFRPGAEVHSNKMPGGKPGRNLTHHLRVPACLSSPFEAMNLWIRFMQTQIDSTVPVLAVHPLDQAWVDITVGEPTPDDIFSIRASRKKVTFTTDIPYALSDDFRRRTQRLLSAHASRQGVGG